MERYIVLSNAIIDREKITWIDRDNGNVTVHFVSGDKDVWDGENANIIWLSFSADKDWRSDPS